MTMSLSNPDVVLGVPHRLILGSNQQTSYVLEGVWIKEEFTGVYPARVVCVLVIDV
jgi:hypothetical protein